MNNTVKTTDEKPDGHQGVTQRAAILMAANVIATALSFALPLVLVRTMSQPEYGLYKQAFQIVLSAMMLLNLQVAVSVFYFMAREPGKKLQVALNVMLFYGMVGALVLLVFLSWPGWVTLIFKGSDLVPHIPLLGLVILSWLVSTNLEGVPIAAGDVRVASVLIVASQSTKAIAMIIAALLFGNLTSILVAAMIQGVIQTAFMAYYLRRRFGRFLAAFDWPLFKAQIGNALPFGVGGIVAIVQNDMHNYFVSHYFDPADFAIYSVGCFQVPLIGMLSTSFASALNPDLARHKEAGDYRAILRLWVDVMHKLALFSVPVFALLLVMRHEFITVLFTATYAASAPIFAINLFTLLIWITMHLHLLRLFDQLRYFRLKLYLALIPVTLGVLYAGWLAGGMIGVAVAAVSMQTLDIGTTLLMIGRELGMTWRDLRLLSPQLRIYAATMVAALPTLMVTLVLTAYTPLARLIAGTMIFGLVYLIAIFAIGAVTREEQAQLRAMASKYHAKWILRKGTGVSEQPI
ncbi:MAG: lipopolysaccharide biosynthesis protein [Blastocatellia bacterium]